jgi:CRISPR-associated protein Cas1
MRKHFQRDSSAAAINDAALGISELDALRSDELQDVRAIEGRCAASYFLVWRALEPKWVNEKRFPVPDDWKGFWSRSSLLTGNSPANYRASHPVNALLNYAYAVQISVLRMQLIGHGFDPSLGVVHHRREGFSPFAYDLIEIERPRIDMLILDIVKQQRFSANDFVIRADGSCRLSPQLAKTIATAVSLANRPGQITCINWLLKTKPTEKIKI